MRGAADMPRRNKIFCDLFKRCDVSRDKGGARRCKLRRLMLRSRRGRVDVVFFFVKIDANVQLTWSKIEAWLSAGSRAGMGSVVLVLGEKQGRLEYGRRAVG